MLIVGDLVLDEDSYEVHRDGEPIQLTATEFELLRFLMRNPRRVLSKTQILDRVWSYDFGGSSSVVELYISYLRKKIDSGRAPMIHTVRGAGYMVKAAHVTLSPHRRAHAGTSAATRRDRSGRAARASARFRSWTLRSRVVLVVVAMLAVLGAAIGTVSVFALQGYLMQRLDSQLTQRRRPRAARGRPGLRRRPRPGRT